MSEKIIKMYSFPQLHIAVMHGNKPPIQDTRKVTKVSPDLIIAPLILPHYTEWETQAHITLDLNQSS